MKRSLIPLLLLAHVPVLFWAFAPPQNADALWPIPGQTPREPDRVALQVRPEAIALVDAHTPSAGPAPAPAPTTAPAPAPAAEPAPAAAAAPSAPAAPAVAPRPPAALSSPPAAAPTLPAVQAVQNPGRQQEAEQPPKP
ncbi:MAG: hypothetical protein ACK47O_12705, partial [Betaproteobacteria bacterium]